MLNEKYIFSAIDLCGTDYKGIMVPYSDIPYSIHAVKRGFILREATSNTDIIIAGMLCDLINFKKEKEDNIRRMFSDQVADLTSMFIGIEDIKSDEKNNMAKILEVGMVQQKLLCIADLYSRLTFMENGLLSPPKDEMISFLQKTDTVLRSCIDLQYVNIYKESKNIYQTILERIEKHVELFK